VDACAGGLQMVESGEEVIFSYDVVFKMSNIR
jgi:hypothetical protein